ncbi:aldo/keto reductase [Candidatus Poribacteria bacterium]|nr:MAG: aldo/keto reductase [Candidatus Poribacteria bacterium]
MEYRSLGRTGTKVSTLCLGCLMFGGRTDESDSMNIIDRAIDGGINFFDTANMYVRGKSEEMVGKAFKRNGKRAQIVLATKVHFRMDDEDPNAQGNSRRHIIEQCEASLQRLQTDYIDLYQIHRPCSDIPIDETLRALDDLIRSGKVRYIGSSTFAAWQVVESLWASKELGLNRFICEQPPYHLLDRSIERELVPMAQTYGTALIPWSPMAGGFLTGKYRRDEARPADSRYQDESRNTDLFSDAAFNVLDVVLAIAAEKGCTPSQFSLAWCAQQPGITSPIVGVRTMEQMEDNLGAIDVEVTDEDRERIDEVAPPGGVITRYYRADFGPHLFRW